MRSSPCPRCCPARRRRRQSPPWRKQPEYQSMVPAPARTYRVSRNLLEELHLRERRRSAHAVETVLPLVVARLSPCRARTARPRQSRALPAACRRSAASALLKEDQLVQAHCHKRRSASPSGPFRDRVRTYHRSLRRALSAVGELLCRKAFFENRHGQLLKTSHSELAV
jgi:hypothetical protein